ncbi:MAG: glycosyltransferase [Bacteroidetes bacterium]|jgi:hypothetical protein|nr:glycosyltransferase [Bacteroidota bacterium]
MTSVTTVMVNYQTPDLLRRAVHSFKTHYPKVPLLIFDNGSQDQSPAMIKTLAKRYAGTVQPHFEEKNIYHGPALHKTLTSLVDTEYCFFLDSDTITHRGTFLEKGVDQLSSGEKNYAIGHVIRVNRRGFKDPHGFPIVVTPYMLMKTAPYRKFPPFIHHGQPVLNNFRKAGEKGYRILHFPMDEYIDHLWRGTASQYGYGLGMRGKLDYVLNKLGL